ncbi:hypothetical protein [Dactylosporangium sp. CA-233914]|uniref:hypothetical protein n=1 Tax=Dactylosporangium sp. CA-233914 TaxID=3239934 RepID=UPI003D89FDFD
MSWPRVAWYGAMSLVAMAWLVLFAAAFLAGRDIRPAILPVLLGSLLVAALRRSRWIRPTRSNER